MSLLYGSFDLYIDHCVCYFLNAIRVVSFGSLTESFALCKKYCPPSQYVPSMNMPGLCVADLSIPSHPPVPFKACGSETGYDSDTNYPLQVCDSYF